jgi:hypothetical protein
MLYSKEEYTNILKNMGQITESAEEFKGNILKPTTNEFKEITKIILKYIQDNKRIIYGGYALNMLIKNKNPNDVIYNEKTSRADVEFYTPEPVKDLYNICNLIYDVKDDKNNNKYKNVVGRQAAHEESYKIAVDYQEYCDMSYLPLNIYNKTKKVSLNNLLFTHPRLIYIDRYRMFNDAFGSAWRWEKEVKRFYLTQKYYPIENNQGSIKIKIKNEDENDNIMKFIEDKFLKTTINVVIFGHYAYNYYLNISKSSRHKIVKIQNIDAVSNNYVEDCVKLYKLLNDEYGSKITKIEYYPFSQLTGFRCCFLYDGNVIANIYANNNRCIPYKNNGDMKIGTFSFVMMMLLILEFYTHVNKLYNENRIYNTMMSNMIDFRNYYLYRNNKTVLDNTPFEEFTIPCIGTTIPQNRLYLINLMDKKEKGKMMLYTYDPQKQRNNDINLNFKFANTSGNSIRHEKNVKIKIKK